MSVLQRSIGKISRNLNYLKKVASTSNQLIRYQHNENSVEKINQSTDSNPINSVPQITSKPKIILTRGFAGNYLVDNLLSVPIY